MVGRYPMAFFCFCSSTYLWNSKRRSERKKKRSAKGFGFGSSSSIQLLHRHRGSEPVCTYPSSLQPHSFVVIVIHGLKILAGTGRYSLKHGLPLAASGVGAHFDSSHSFHIQHLIYRPGWLCGECGARESRHHQGWGW